MSLESFLVFDAGVAAAVIAGSVLFVYTIGKYAVVPAIAALGMGATFASLAPFVGRIPGISAWPAHQQHIAVFIVVAVIAFVLFRRHSYFEPSVPPNGFERAVCGIVIAGFILGVLASFLPVDIFTTLSPHIRGVFADPLQRTLWLSAPILLFAVMRGR